jgi:hypothetical protein
VTRALLLALALACGSAAGEEVGFVSHVAGEVTYAMGNGTAKAKPFMKLREGERFSANPGARVRIVYFQSGRQESYSGPVSFTIGTLESMLRSGAQPQVSTLPEGVPQKISQTPELVQIAKLGASRSILVRAAREQRLSPQQLAEVRQAREIYEQLRQSEPVDDITPELYLYSVLHDNLAYNEMRPVVAEMQRRQPGNADVAIIADYVRAKTGR